MKKRKYKNGKSYAQMYRLYRAFRKDTKFIKQSYEKFRISFKMWLDYKLA